MQKVPFSLQRWQPNFKQREFIFTEVYQKYNLQIKTVVKPLNEDANLRDLENSISDKIGLSVSIKNSKKNKRSIEKTYFVERELKNINLIIYIISIS